MQCICVGEASRVPNLQTEFNYLNSFKSYGIFSDFIVPMWSLWSPCHPHHPHIISTSSPCCPRHPHIIPIALRRSPCGPQGCGLRGLHPCCPCHPHRPHVIPVIPMSFPHCLKGLQIISNPQIPTPPTSHPLEGWGAPNH